MTSFEPGTVVRVPFPYVDKERRHYRPAVVISRPLGSDASLIWVLMITAAENDDWPGDVAIGGSPDLTGLPIQSMVRTAKVATIEVSSASPLGRLPAATWRRVKEELSRALGK